MFDFPIEALARDLVITSLSLIIIHGLALLLAWVSFKLKKIEKISFKEYFMPIYKRPLVTYGLLAFALFFAVYLSKLVVIRMLLAICYAFILARAFLSSDPRA